ncbi:MAG: hypothetical protein ACK5P7_01625, partial [Bdellovibrio sp.]
RAAFDGGTLLHWEAGTFEGEIVETLDDLLFLRRGLTDSLSASLSHFETSSPKAQSPLKKISASTETLSV